MNEQEVYVFVNKKVGWEKAWVSAGNSLIHIARLERRGAKGQVLNKMVFTGYDCVYPRCKERFGC